MDKEAIRGALFNYLSFRRDLQKVQEDMTELREKERQVEDDIRKAEGVLRTALEIDDNPPWRVLVELYGKLHLLNRDRNISTYLGEVEEVK